VTLVRDLPAVKRLSSPTIAELGAIFPALFAAVAALILVSAFTPKPTPAQLAKLAEQGASHFRIGGDILGTSSSVLFA
jgi:hypothetical protein